MDCVNRDMRAIGNTKDEVHDRTGWRRIVSAAATHVGEHASKRPSDDTHRTTHVECIRPVNRGPLMARAESFALKDCDGAQRKTYDRLYHRQIVMTVIYTSAILWPVPCTVHINMAV